jgi:hypothetical protein
VKRSSGEAGSNVHTCASRLSLHAVVTLKSWTMIEDISRPILNADLVLDRGYLDSVTGKNDFVHEVGMSILLHSEVYNSPTMVCSRPANSSQCSH